MIFKYSVEGIDYEIYECDVDNPYDDFCEYSYEFIIEEIAENYYFNHDGCKYKWPLTFTIYNKEKIILGKTKIYLDYEPIFYSYFKKEKKEE